MLLHRGVVLIRDYWKLRRRLQGQLPNIRSASTTASVKSNARISTSVPRQGPHRTPRGSASAASPSAGARTPAASAADQSSAGQPALALEMPVECPEYWDCMRTAGRAKINPAYHPYSDDGSDRYIVVECDIRTLMHAKLCVIYCVGAWRSRICQKSDLMGILKAERVVGPNLTYEEQRCCFEWLTTSTRHKPFHTNYLSGRFLRAVPAFDEFDGWVELSELLNQWPPEG
eukprot:7451914-Pyramimonas_sp.AAC.1